MPVSTKIRLFIPVLLLASSGVAIAEVTDSAANGFSIKQELVVDADRMQVFDSMIEGVGQWWSDDHTMSGFASNLYIDARALGCFCEKLPDGGGVVHMIVTFVNRGVMLRLTGGLGPLGLMGVNGNMTWEFSDDDNGTLVTLHYAVGGYMHGGLDSVAPAVDAVLLEQMMSLKTFVERSAGKE